MVFKEVLWSVRGSYQTIWGPPLPNFTRHSWWWPSAVRPSIDQVLQKFLTLLLISSLLPNLTFYLIARGFRRTFTTGVACQQMTLSPPVTWSCPTLWLAIVLMLRQISPELVLFPDFWVSNIRLYFCFLLLLINFIAKPFHYVTNMDAFHFSKSEYIWSIRVNFNRYQAHMLIKRFLYKIDMSANGTVQSINK